MYMREVDNAVMIQYIILFTLTKANRKISHSQLTCLTLDRCNINFTNFQIALDNLVGIGYIKKEDSEYEDNMPLYSLTEKGIEANGFFEHSIPIYIRDQIAEYIVPFFEKEQLKKSIKAKLKEVSEKEYGAECGIYDSTSALMELTFYGDRKTAAKMVRNFKKRPEEIYTKIMKLLLEGEDD